MSWNCWIVEAAKFFGEATMPSSGGNGNFSYVRHFFAEKCKFEKLKVVRWIIQMSQFSSRLGEK